LQIPAETVSQNRLQWVFEVARRLLPIGGEAVLRDALPAKRRIKVHGALNVMAVFSAVAVSAIYLNV
jgi:hypothetical protein